MRVVKRRRFQRTRYEVDLKGERHVTRTPVTLLDPYLGVGDAWTLVHASEARWDGTTGEWVTLNVDA
jgi:hypothetical protein